MINSLLKNAMPLMKINTFLASKPLGAQNEKTLCSRLIWLLSRLMLTVTPHRNYLMSFAIIVPIVGVEFKKLSTGTEPTCHIDGKVVSQLILNTMKLIRTLTCFLHLKTFFNNLFPLQYSGNLTTLEKLAEELNIKLTKEETWSFRTKERGLKYEFGDLLKFLTVKRGDHHVTSSRLSQAFSIFSNFAINWIH
ncbi:hypothetical protein CXB51_010287 [Gossypium anomalum]|uniref:Uncharacterized protein n=1 Tax=Gossypium anomalum TaxID=47600 RepID=A0A8J6D233_9ROSI|nr:hypothetical protein CXB51_010287 [Gossypium anomalum]